MMSQYGDMPNSMSTPIGDSDRTTPGCQSRCLGSGSNNSGNGNGGQNLDLGHNL